MNKIIEIISQYSIFIVIGLIIITVLLLIMNLILLSSVNKLEKKYRKMMRGVNNKNLEEVINDNLDNIERHLKNQKWQ